MKGHVRKHGRGWQWIINRDGHQTSKAGFPTRTAAQDALNRELVRVSDGVNVDRSTMTVRSYLVDLWLPAVKGSLARTTYANYKTHVDQHLVDQLGDVPLQKLSEAHLLKSWATLRESGRRRGKNPKDKGLSPATVRHIHRMLHKALEDAVEWRYLSRNVAASRQAKPPTAKGEAQELKAWSAGELKRFLASISENRLVPMWRFMAMTGCRRGEALGLRWDDVNLKTRSVRIMRSRTGYGISTPKTKTSTRGVDLDPGTTALKAWRRAQRLERVKAGPGWEDSNLVFTREDGLGITRTPSRQCSVGRWGGSRSTRSPCTD